MDIGPYPQCRALYQSTAGGCGRGYIWRPPRSESILRGSGVSLGADLQVGGTARRARNGAANWRRIDWRILLIAVYVGINLALLIRMPPAYNARDWAIWKELPDALSDGRLYHLQTDVPFVWSPVVAPVMALVGLTGFWPQAVLQVSLVALLRDRLMILLVLSSFLFWPAVAGGNPLFTLTLVAAIGAFRGSHGWSLGFLVLATLIPRPLTMPLAVWLLWRRSRLRWPFAGLLAAHAAVVAATGYIGPWAEIMRDLAAAMPAGSWGTEALAGTWMLVRVPLGVWLTYRNHPGWGGLLVSPYILSGYLLFPIIEMRTPLNDSRLAIAEATSAAD